MNIELCPMTTAAFITLCQTNRLHHDIAGNGYKATLGASLYLYCDGTNLYLQSTGVIQC